MNSLQILYRYCSCIKYQAISYFEIRKNYRTLFIEFLAVSNEIPFEIPVRISLQHSPWIILQYCITIQRLPHVLPGNSLIPTNESKNSFIHSFRFFPSFITRKISVFTTISNTPEDSLLCMLAPLMVLLRNLWFTSSYMCRRVLARRDHLDSFGNFSVREFEYRQQPPRSIEQIKQASSALCLPACLLGTLCSSTKYLRPADRDNLLPLQSPFRRYSVHPRWTTTT